MAKNLYKVTCTTPYCGTDMEYWVFADSEDDICKSDCEEWAYENGQSFEYLAAGGWGEELESEEERDDYYADCCYDISGPYSLEDATDEGFSGLADAEY